MSEDFIKMDIYPEINHTESYSEILLTNNTNILPIYVSFVQAESIKNGLEGKRYSRPFTHDLFAEVINSLNASIKKVVIDDLIEGVYMARLYIEVCKNENEEEIVVDARPSDCIALAAREGCPIFVSQKVIDEAGKKREEIDI